MFKKKTPAMTGADTDPCAKCGIDPLQVAGPEKSVHEDRPVTPTMSRLGFIPWWDSKLPHKLRYECGVCGFKWTRTSMDKRVEA